MDGRLSSSQTAAFYLNCHADWVVSERDTRPLRRRHPGQEDGDDGQVGRVERLGCDSIDILNLRLELGPKIREWFRTRLGGRHIGRQ